jgi:hypothetical protein
MIHAARNVRRRLATIVPVALLAASLLGAGTARPATPVPRTLVLPEAPAVRELPPPEAAVRSHGYGWPIKPFDVQHPIRGGFGDPRFGLVERNFHFGVDIPAAGGTPVYAVAAGTVFLEPDHVDVLSHAVAGHATGFSYWHIIPAPREYSYAKPHTLLGWVNPSWGHLHFAELRAGRWVNPLRNHALTPYVDFMRPQIDAITVTPAGALSADSGASMPIDITVDAFAPPYLPLAAPWEGARLAPTLVEWRLLSGTVPVSGWQMAADFRRYIPPNQAYSEVYAPGTEANGPGHPGRYVIYLARDWQLGNSEPEPNAIEVAAFGSRGEVARASAALDVADLVTPAPHK